MTMYRESKKEKKHRKLIPKLNQIRLRAIAKSNRAKSNIDTHFWKKDI